MKARNHRPAYVANLHNKSWQIVIPVAGSLAPLVWKSNFRSKDIADQWLMSEAGRCFVATAQKERRLSSQNIQTSTSTEVEVSNAIRIGRGSAGMEMIPNMLRVMKPGAG